MQETNSFQKIVIFWGHADMNISFISSGK